MKDPLYLPIFADVKGFSLNIESVTCMRHSFISLFRLVNTCDYHANLGTRARMFELARRLT